MLGIHVLPLCQTGKQTRRLASARRAPLRQYKRCIGIAVLPTGLIPIGCVLPALVMTAPDLRHPHVKRRMPWKTTALRHPNRVSHPWKCAHQQSLVAYFPPATSISTRIFFNQPPLPLYSTEEMNSKTSTPYVSYDSRFFQMNNLPAAPSCRRVIGTKSEENRMFNLGGSRSSPRLPVFGIVARIALWGDSC